MQSRPGAVDPRSKRRSAEDVAPPETVPLARPPAEFYDLDDAENRCFACGNPRFRLLHETTRFGFPIRFQICQCGLLKQTPMPNERFFEWFFNSDLFRSSKRVGSDPIWGYYDFFSDEACRLATSRLRFRRFRRYFDGPRPKRILKIGPSTGTFLHVAAEAGHDVLGCDVSEQFVTFARDHYGVRIDQGRFERMGYPDGHFDAIFLFNVIENVPNQNEFLSAVARCLRPGGHFFVNFVDMKRNWVERLQGSRYFLYRPPICYGFDRDLLPRILAGHGLNVVARHRDIRVMHVEKMSTLLGWRWPVALTRWAGLHRMPIPVYAYPSRILVARK